MSKVKITINYRMGVDNDYVRRMLWCVCVERKGLGVYHTFVCKPTAKQLRKMVKFCKVGNWGKVLKV